MDQSDICPSPGSLRSRYAVRGAESRPLSPRLESSCINPHVASPCEGFPSDAAPIQDRTGLAERERELQDLREETSRARQQAEAVRARRQHIEDAMHATTSEIRSAKSELQSALDALRAEQAALSSAGRRGAMLLQHLERFQALQSQLAKALESAPGSSLSSPQHCAKQPQELDDTSRDAPHHGWEPLTAEEKDSCRKAFARAAAGSPSGVECSKAQELAAKGMGSTQVDLGWLVELADRDSDGALSEQEFALMLFLMKQCRLGAELPQQLDDLEVLRILQGSAAAPENQGENLERSSKSFGSRERLRPPAPLVLPEACGSDHLGYLGALSTDSDNDSVLATPSPHRRTPNSQHFDAWEWAHSPLGRDAPPLAEATSVSVPRAVSLPAGSIPRSPLGSGADGEGALTSWRRTSGGTSDGSSSKLIGHSRSHGGSFSGAISNAAVGSVNRHSDDAVSDHSVRQPPVAAACLECGLRHPLVPEAAIRITIEKVGLDSSKSLEEPFVGVSIRDVHGAVQVSEQRTPAAVNRANRYIMLQYTLELPLPALDSLKGSAVFFELKHWKAKSRKVSLKAWSAMPLGPLLQECRLVRSGFVVRAGALNLPLYMKPLDPMRRKCKRIPSKTFDLHLHIGWI